MAFFASPPVSTHRPEGVIKKGGIKFIMVASIATPHGSQRDIVHLATGLVVGSRNNAS